MRHSYLFIIAIMLAVMTPRIAPAQSIAVKSNVLYDLTSMEKPRDFDPFGQTGLSPLATI